MTNVAVHEPDTWVVGLECDDHPPSSGEGCNVTSGGIFEVQLRHISGGEDLLNVGSVCLAKNGEFMSVKMDWMRNTSQVLDHPIVPLLSQELVERSKIARAITGLLGPNLRRKDSGLPCQRL